MEFTSKPNIVCKNPEKLFCFKNYKKKLCQRNDKLNPFKSLLYNFVPSEYPLAGLNGFNLKSQSSTIYPLQL